MSRLGDNWSLTRNRYCYDPALTHHFFHHVIHHQTLWQHMTWNPHMQHHVTQEEKHHYHVTMMSLTSPMTSWAQPLMTSLGQTLMTSWKYPNCAYCTWYHHWGHRLLIQTILSSWPTPWLIRSPITYSSIQSLLHTYQSHYSSPHWYHTYHVIPLTLASIYTGLLIYRSTKPDLVPILVL